MIQKIEDYSQRMKELLLYQFQNSPNIHALLEIYGEQLNDVEDTLWELLESLDVNLAYGYALDLIGKEVGQLRNGADDDYYRKLILLKIFINNSSATPNDVIEITKLLFDVPEITYSEVYPAAVLLEINTTNADRAANAPLLRQILPAGVDLIYEIKLDVDAAINYAACAYSHMIEFEVNPVIPPNFLDDNGFLISTGRITSESKLFHT